MHYKPSGSYMNNKSLKGITDTWKGVLISLVFNNGILNVSMHNCLTSFFPPLRVPLFLKGCGRSVNTVLLICNQGYLLIFHDLMQAIHSFSNV